ncbi:PIN domain-containing protein [Candidatus Woesearchaeota archaeon]|nr:PIN domain-containing protein [Candidatus Woesearchaeota archaeon]
MEDFYFDTSIWLDFFEKRGEHGEAALALITKIIRGGLKIAYSDMTIKEFRNLGYTSEEINTIFSVVKPDNIKRIHINREQKEEARKLALQRDIPKGDALHAVLARDNFVQLISRDGHFQKLKDITSVKKPEEII